MNIYNKNLLSVGTLSLVNILLQFTLSLVISRVYGPEGRGLIYFPITLVTLFLPLLTLGLKQSMSYLLSSKKIDLKLARVYLFRYFIPLLTIFSLFYSVIFIYFNSEYTTYFFVIFIIVIARVITDVYSFYHILLKKPFVINVIATSRTILDIISTFVIILNGFGALWLIFGFAISSTIAMLLQLTIVRKISYSHACDCSHNVNPNVVLSKGLQFSLPLFLVGLNVSFDLVILKYFRGLADVGIYQTSVTIANLIWVLPSILSSVSFSFALAAKDNHDEFDKLIKKTFNIIILSFPVVIVLFLMSDFIFITLYGEQFVASSKIFKILLPGYFIMLIYKIMYPFVAAKGNTLGAMIVFFLGFFINLVLNIILTPKYGPVGTAFSTLFSYGICGICFILVSYRTVKKND